MACYRTEMLNQSVASLWEHQRALKKVSVGFGSFFYSFWLLVGWLLFFLLFWFGFVSPERRTPVIKIASFSCL